MAVTAVCPGRGCLAAARNLVKAHALSRIPTDALGRCRLAGRTLCTHSSSPKPRAVQIQISNDKFLMMKHITYQQFNSATLPHVSVYVHKYGNRASQKHDTSVCTHAALRALSQACHKCRIAPFLPSFQSLFLPSHLHFAPHTRSPPPPPIHETSMPPPTPVCGPTHGGRAGGH